MRGILVFSLLIASMALLAWAPWLDGQESHDMVFMEKADKDGTMGWVILPDGSMEYMLICDYAVHWAPFGRWVASCEGDYVTFWGKIIP